MNEGRHGQFFNLSGVFCLLWTIHVMTFLISGVCRVSEIFSKTGTLRRQITSLLTASDHPSCLCNQEHGRLGRRRIRTRDSVYSVEAPLYSMKCAISDCAKSANRWLCTLADSLLSPVLYLRWTKFTYLSQKEPLSIYISSSGLFYEPYKRWMDFNCYRILFTVGFAAEIVAGVLSCWDSIFPGICYT